MLRCVVFETDGARYSFALMRLQDTGRFVGDEKLVRWGILRQADFLEDGSSYEDGYCRRR
jgi:hypothetical protein